MSDIDTVAEFIASFNTNPIYHSIWLGLKEIDGKPYLDPDTDRYQYEIKIAIRPRFEHKFAEIPKEYKGLPIQQVPWPKESA